MLAAEFLGRLDREMTSHYKRGTGEVAGIKVERKFVGRTPEWLVGHFAVRHAADPSREPYHYLAFASPWLDSDSGLAVVRTFPEGQYPRGTFALAVDPTARFGGEHSPELRVRLRDAIDPFIHRAGAMAHIAVNHVLWGQDPLTGDPIPESDLYVLAARVSKLEIGHKS